jgi:hypothetical protein
MPWRPCEGAPGSAPKGVEFEEHDHDNHQDVHDRTENHLRRASQHDERPVFGPLQAAAGVFEGAARGTEGTTVQSNAGCSCAKGSENPHRWPRL